MSKRKHRQKQYAAGFPTRHQWDGFWSPRVTSTQDDLDPSLTLSVYPALFDSFPAFSPVIFLQVILSLSAVFFGFSVIVVFFIPSFLSFISSHISLVISTFNSYNEEKKTLRYG